MQARNSNSLRLTDPTT